MAEREPVKRAIARTAKGVFTSLGLDVRRLAKSPGHTFLGLKSLKIRSILDIGANVGQFARRASEAFPDATLYCFEPLPDPFAALRTWAEDAAPRRVRPFNLALGDAEGELTFYRHVAHSDSSSLLKTTAECEGDFPHTRDQVAETVRVRRLDSVMAELATPPETELLVKLDVQGYEEHVLRGGPETLQRAAAVIIEVCLDPLYQGQATFEGLASLLGAHGLRYAGNLDQSYAEDGHVVFLDAVFRRHSSQ